MFPNLIRPAGFGSAAVSGGGRRYSTAIVSTQGRTGLTTIVSALADDANITIGDIGFDFPLYGALYRSNIFAGSNGYLTFGFGTNAYSSLSLTNPGRALMVMAADRSWLYVGVQQSTGSFRTRWEGQTGSSTGTSMVWEATLFANGVIQLVFGLNMPNNGGVKTFTKGDGAVYTDYLPTNTLYVNDGGAYSLVFTPNDAAGNSHTVQVGSYA